MSVPFDMVLTALRAAAEPTRLRLLALLAQAELTVGEICQVVAQSQPRVSRHLKLLCDAGLLDRFREQSFVYYRAPAVGEGRLLLDQVLGLIASDDKTLQRDRARLERVIAERGRQAASELRERRVIDTGASDSAEIGALVLNEIGADPLGRLLDIGTGEGHLLKAFASRASRAVGIDLSTEALRLARSNVHGAGLSHCELQRGDMYDLPFPAGAFDTIVMDRVLADAERPFAALAEAARTLDRGGRLILIEDFDALSDTFDRNPIALLREWLDQLGLACERIRPADTQVAHLVLTIARRVVSDRKAA
jgi:ArsR family transcriptional regulator